MRCESIRHLLPGGADEKAGTFMNRHGGECILRTRPHESAALRRLSKKGRRVDALALRAEERRDKLRKAAGRSKYPESRGCLNGETRIGKTLCIHM